MWDKLCGKTVNYTLNVNNAFVCKPRVLIKKLFYFYLYYRFGITQWQFEHKEIPVFIGNYNNFLSFLRITPK